MGKVLARIALGIGVFFLVITLVVRMVVVPRVDASMNGVFAHDRWPVSSEAAALHDTLRVSDLHADTLLWARDPAERHDFGHTDLPRLREGGTFLQVFTAVTKSPNELNYDENTSGSDDITSLAIAQGWPMEAWTSLEARARYQARRLYKIADGDESFFIVSSQADLKMLLARRARDPFALGGILGIEGAHPLEGELSAIDRLYAEGYRVMGLQHFFDNELGGSLHGVEKGGLTSFGRAAVDKMEAMRIVIDLAHSSEAVVEEVLGRTTNPVIVSHTGVKSLCNTPRNIRDELLLSVAKRGGLIGIGFWDDAVCDATPDGIAATIDKAVALFGDEAIALGSDFDGAVSTYFDASEMSAVTHALLARGMSAEQIEKIMGGNVIRFFSENLPVTE